MVQADVIVGEISCRQKLGFLDDFEDLENVSEMVEETSKASKDQQSESATGENNTYTCMHTCSEKCCQ